MKCECGMEYKTEYNDTCPRCGAAPASQSELIEPLGWTPNPVVNGCVEPARIYRPIFCTITWFKNFAFQCGACGKESVKFAFFGSPTCPYCKTRNTPRWEIRP